MKLVRKKAGHVKYSIFGRLKDSIVYYLAKKHDKIIASPELALKCMLAGKLAW